MKYLISIILSLVPLLSSASENMSIRGQILSSIPSKHNYISIYINRIWDESEYCALKYNIPHSLVIAQMCIESDFGRRRLVKKNNHLRIRFEGKYAEFETLEKCLDVYGYLFSSIKCPNNDCKKMECWFFMLERNCWHHRGKRYSKRVKSVIKKFKLYLIN